MHPPVPPTTQPTLPPRALAWDLTLALVGTIVTLLAWSQGLTDTLITQALIAYVPIGLGLRLVAVYRRRLSFAFVRHPLAPEHRGLLVRCLLGWALLGVTALVLRVAVLPEDLGEELVGIVVLLIGLLTCAAAFELVPLRSGRLPTTVARSAATLFFGAQLVMLYFEPGEGGRFVLDVPFEAETLVVHGGPSPLVNHHYLLTAQRHALDVVPLRDGKMQHGAEESLETYACFRQPVLAPAAGRVVRATGDRPDNAIGSTDEAHLVGNHVAIDVGSQRFVLLAHLRQHSLRVAVGDQVLAGQPIGECGNSGNTSAPHLHIQVQDRPDYARDGRTFPVRFRSAVRIRAGERSHARTVAVRRGDHLKRAPAAPAP